MPSDDIDKQLMEKMLLTYIPGKGDHLVPILFPVDTTNALNILSNLTIRKQSGVNDSNKFLYSLEVEGTSKIAITESVINACSKNLVRIL